MVNLFEQFICMGLLLFTVLFRAGFVGSCIRSAVSTDISTTFLVFLHIVKKTQDNVLIM